MALINCPDCGGQVSDKAASCPQCGHPMKAAVRGNGMGVTIGWMAVAVTALILALFALISTCKWRPV